MIFILSLAPFLQNTKTSETKWKQKKKRGGFMEFKPVIQVVVIEEQPIVVASQKSHRSSGDGEEA